MVREGLKDSGCLTSKDYTMEVHEVAVRHLVLRVFDLLVPSCTPFVVLSCDALTAEFRRRVHRKLSPRAP